MGTALSSASPHSPLATCLIVCSAPIAVPGILAAVATATSGFAKAFLATVPTVPGCDIAAVAALVDKFVIWVATC